MIIIRDIIKIFNKNLNLKEAINRLKYSDYLKFTDTCKKPIIIYKTSDEIYNDNKESIAKKSKEYYKENADERKQYSKELFSNG